MTTKNKSKAISTEVKEILSNDGDLLRNIIQKILQEILEVEMDQALGASKSQRIELRLCYRCDHYPTTLTTRVGKIELCRTNNYGAKANR